MDSRPLLVSLLTFLTLSCIGALPDAVGADAAASSFRVQAAPPLLDDYPDAYAAYSLRLLRSDYAGPALRVRRSSDGEEQDFGFTAEGALEVAAIESWLGTADGYVVRWYSQVAGEPDLVQTTPSRQPRIASGGGVTTDGQGRPALKFDRARGTFLVLESSLSTSLPLHNMLSMLVGEHGGDRHHILNFQTIGDWSQSTLSLRTSDGGAFTIRSGFTETIWPSLTHGPAAWIINTDGAALRAYNNHAKVGTGAVSGTSERSTFVLGTSTKDTGNWPFEGYISALILFPGQTTDDAVQDRYDVLNAAYNLGPTDYNRDAILPQEKDWQVALYNWMKTLSVTDVTLPAQTLRWDGGLSDVDDVADLWMQLEGASASRVVRAEPEWYVLDAGNGKGIEATGTVRIWHQPESGPGNPPRSWSNEPAFLYQLSAPNGDGSQGNPYYQLRALGLRALVVAAADMMMYAEEDGYGHWTDMYGKALLGWAEAYRWCKRELPAETQQAFEEAFAMYLDRIIVNGARAVNTNMDMFAMHAAAEIYMATGDAALEDKAVQAVKRTLLGYTDGGVETNHDVFAAGSDYNNGVFAPAGYIMEGDQPDVFYMGESLYHLTGALAAVTDRQSGAVASDWVFLEDVVRRMEAWSMHQGFYDPGINSPGSGGLKNRHYWQGPAGFAGRTGAGFPQGQASEIWRNLSLADRFTVSHPRLYSAKAGHLSRGAEGMRLPEEWEMEDDIQNKLSWLTSKLSSAYEGTPPEWKGWSPWTKPTPYLPPKGWYSRLDALADGQDPSVYLPIARDGHYYNKMFGGPPTGGEYWAYKQSDGTRDWGFYVEAQARQGGYGGWYGGKLEAFWTETTGVVIVNRHGKTGCDDQFEDSMCWDNLEYRAGHHVWGRDETGNGFTTLHLRGRELQRTSRFDLEGSPPTVEVVNVFNDPSHASNPTRSETGEQTGSEIEGSFEITNTFEAHEDGLQITHTLTSGQTDDVTELWASIPIFLRAVSSDNPGDQPQIDYEDTSIEYWNGSAWRAMPGDSDGDGVPEFVTTTALRLGRDFELGAGPQYVYVEMETAQHVRLATQAYEDPYQTKTRVRTVHIDLHGNPGTVQPLPAEKSVTYTVQTTATTGGSDAGGGGGGEGAGGGTTPVAGEQDIALQQGWNLVSTAVRPDDTGMEAMFGDIRSAISLVRNQRGDVYDPSAGLDEIGAWKANEAYAIFAESAVTLSIRGVDLGSSGTAITLREGWNWVPYPLKQPMPVADALASILDQLMLVKDEDGRAYSPSKKIDSLGSLQPGKGYKIYVKQATTLTYPSVQ